MDSNEQKNGSAFTVDRDARISVVLSQPGDGGEIDLGRILDRLKEKRRVYAWVVLLCFVAGLCASGLWVQLTQPPLTVSSVVTLCYEVPNPLLDPLKNPLYTPALLEDESIPRIVPVTDLTAPDGSELDLGQVTSSYVLQTALNGMELSQPLTLANLSSNITIEKILTEDSRRRQEVVASMIQEKNSSAYNQVQDLQLTYDNQFVVSLTNGFGDEDSRVKRYLTGKELRLVLDRILVAYNATMAATYANSVLPDDEISVIDTAALDLPESVDMLRSAMDNLLTYCEDKSETIRAYRSWRSGLSLNDLVAHLKLVKSSSVDYLYSFLYANNIARDPQTMLVSLQYQLRSARTELDSVYENIENTAELIKNYRNDEIFVSMQDSDSTKSTSAATDYYNRIVLKQAANYERAAQLETTIASLSGRIDNMSAGTGDTDTQSLDEELNNALEACRACYDQIKAHMEEITTSVFFTTYADHSVAQGRTEGFLAGGAKKLLIGAAAGLALGFALWFLAALLPELHAHKREEDGGKEAEA